MYKIVTKIPSPETSSVNQVCFVMLMPNSMLEYEPSKRLKLDLEIFSIFNKSRENVATCLVVN